VKYKNDTPLTGSSLALKLALYRSNLGSLFSTTKNPFVDLHFFPSFLYCWPRHTSQVLLAKTASLTYFAFSKTFAFPSLLFFEDVENKTSEAAKQEKSSPCLHVGGFVVLHTLIDLPPSLVVSSVFREYNPVLFSENLVFFYLVV